VTRKPSPARSIRPLPNSADAVLVTLPDPASRNATSVAFSSSSVVWTQASLSSRLSAQPFARNSEAPGHNGFPLAESSAMTAAGSPSPGRPAATIIRSFASNGIRYSTGAESPTCDPEPKTESAVTSHFRPGGPGSGSTDGSSPGSPASAAY